MSVEQRLPLSARLAALLGEEGKRAEQLKGLAWRIQWLRLHASPAGAAGSIASQGTKIPMPLSRKKKSIEKFETVTTECWSRGEAITGPWSQRPAARGAGWPVLRQ